MGEERQRVAVIEDNAAQRMILTRLLGSLYDVVEFSSGEEFLAGAPAVDAVLLDIEMPGLNGYQTCERLRQLDGDQRALVIFVSAHDTAPERVAAYEAGGDDFVTKPIAASELLHKVATALTAQARLRALSAQSSTAQQVAFTAMSSMGDLGVIIDFMRQSACRGDYAALAGDLAAAMFAWGLQGAVQVRGISGCFNLSVGEGDVASPLQASVMENLRGMGRIFEMGSRAVVNFTHVSLLVQNLPTDDPDKVGRLRDHLALLGESADARLESLDAVTLQSQQRSAVGETLQDLRGLVLRLSKRTGDNHVATRNRVVELLDALQRSLSSMGLNDFQENYIGDMVRTGTDDLLNHFDEARTIEQDFSSIFLRLRELSNPSA
jgi:CheY-like chemotaxis protein